MPLVCPLLVVNVNWEFKIFVGGHNYDKWQDDLDLSEFLCHEEWSGLDETKLDS